MNTLSFGSHSFLSPLPTPSRGGSAFRPATDRTGRSPFQPRPTRTTAASRFSPVDDRVSNGLALGLVAFTLPAVGYAFHQLWQLVGGETLHQAVRAFAP